MVAVRDSAGKGAAGAAAGSRERHRRAAHRIVEGVLHRRLQLGRKRRVNRARSVRILPWP